MTLSGQTPVNSTLTSDFRHTRSIGLSVESRPILMVEPHSRKTGGILLIAGLHGDERATVLVVQSFVGRFLCCGPMAARNVRAIPVANPDGYERNSRYNAHGVDLNRNFETNWSRSSEEPSGPAPWSEPESRALRDLILETRPAGIISLHWALAEIDADGPQSTPLARAMWDALSADERAPYRIRVWEDAPGRGFTADNCPGSLGQWCGYQLRYPDGTAPAVITLELPYDPELPRPAILPADHLETLSHTWTTGACRYMAAVEGPIHKMLAAACGLGMTDQ